MSNKTHLLILYLVVSIGLFGFMVWSAEATPTAAIIVNTKVDELNGPLGNTKCSLREAIENLNNNNQGQGDCGSGAIYNAINLPAGYYTLTLTGTLDDENNNAYGDLDILDDIVIIGTNKKTTIIQAGTGNPITGSCSDCIDRVLDIDSANVIIKDLTIRYGNSPDGDHTGSYTSGHTGGGIRQYGGNLRLENCSVSQNKAGDGEPGYDAAGGYGGGISSDGSLELVNSTVFSNKAGAGSTGIGFPGVEGGNGGYGGGINLWSQELMTITNSSISGNYAGRGGSADDTDGMDAGDGGSGGRGGGIHTGGTITIENSEIINNYAGNGAPGGSASGTGSWDGGDGGNGGHGGGIFITYNNSLTSIINTTISGNWTGLPGRGAAGTGSGSTGTNGYRGSGGGIHLNDGALYIERSTLTDNHALIGGGLSNDDVMTVINSTISGNKAYEVGGGIYTGGTSEADFIFSTITDNTADVDGNGTGDGGGIYNSTGTITLTNTILAVNIDNGLEYPDCYGTINSGDYNLVGDDSGTWCTFLTDTNDLVGPTITPGLDPLDDYGGPTETHALLVTSDALSWIPYGTNGCGTIFNQDQRGEPRYGSCDIGAYERSFFLYLPLMLR